MSSPPWLFACIVSLIVAWSSDRTQEKVCSHKLILLLVSILTILKVLAHCWSYLHWFSRIHHQHVNTQRCCTIPCSLPPSIFLRWVCRASRIINLSKFQLTSKLDTSSSILGSAQHSLALLPSEPWPSPLSTPSHNWVTSLEVTSGVSRRMATARATALLQPCLAALSSVLLFFA